MAHKVASIICMILLPLISAQAEHGTVQPNESDLRVVPVERTPESNTVKLQLVFPEKGEIKSRDPVRLQLNISGFSLRTNSQFPREKEITNDPEGQSIRVVIDNRHFFSINRSNVRDIDSRESFRTQIAEVTIPFSLSEGRHIVRAYPVRSYNESLKNNGTFAMDSFYFYSRKNTLKQSLEQPFLTYNEPSGTFDYGVNTPVLLDFLITNTELSHDGYKVELIIDGKHIRNLTHWAPYYLYGLKKGSHTIQLRLLDPQNNQVPGIFNDVKETIYIR